MTAELEGPGSPVNALLAANPPGKKKAGARPTLADRIRALQDKATQERAAKERGAKDKIGPSPIAAPPVVPEHLTAEHLTPDPLPRNQRAAG